MRKYRPQEQWQGLSALSFGLTPLSWFTKLLFKYNKWTKGIDGPKRVSHDQNFKNLIIDYPRQAIELFSPEEARHIGPKARVAW